MSAFVVDQVHIDAIITVALDGPADTSEDWYPAYFDGQSIRINQADALGRLLIAQNVFSVNARYPGSSPNGLPGPVNCYWEEPYAYRPTGRQPTIIEALKLLDCYEYQSCEDDGWDNSPAQRFTDALRSQLISHLPGYDDAPWEWGTQPITGGTLCGR